MNDTELVAVLETLLDRTWRRIISGRQSQVCKHYVAANLLSDMESVGFRISKDLAKAVVDADDETALAQPKVTLVK